MNKKLLEINIRQIENFPLTQQKNIAQEIFAKKKISHLGGGYRKQRKSTFGKFHDKMLRIIHALFSTQRVDPNIPAIASE